MKCLEFEQNIQLLIDKEIELPERQKLTEHLAICKSCQQESANLQQVKNLLTVQPQILPNKSFDNRMLQAIQNHQSFHPKAKQNWFASFLTFSKPAFAIIALAIALGSAFFLGRISVSTSSQPLAAIVEKTETAPIEKIITTEPVEKIITKTVTKYVEIPVVKEKIVEKKIYINKPILVKEEKTNTKEQQEILADETRKKQQEDIAKQFNLKDLQPVANVTYQIIRKGENNE